LTLTQLADQSSYIGYITESLYNCQLYNWWVDDENYQLFTNRIFASKVTFPLNFFIPYSMRSKIIQKLQFIDFTQETDDMVYDRADEIYKSLSVKLGNQNYFFGDYPTTLDAIVYGFLITQTAANLPKNNLRNLILNYHNLVEYCNRLTTLFFGPESQGNLVYLPLIRPKKTKASKSTQQLQNEQFSRYLLAGGALLLLFFAYNWNYVFADNVKTVQQQEGDNED